LSAIDSADRILLVVDSSNDFFDASSIEEYLSTMGPFFTSRKLDTSRITIVRNKVDLQKKSPSITQEIMANNNSITSIQLSAKHHQGIDILQKHLKECMGYHANEEGCFIARRRHLNALELANEHLQHAYDQLSMKRSSELVAEDLRVAHRYLGEITGEFTADDLLGRIFSSFCVGK